ncbi:FAD-dependent oxidoreductase, partial [Halomonas sp. BM-2019]|uniref:FAD-dependent oxidoreductase n=1 Tax=Halomonas sp. BM-2019 TaxID=2811227 RepID=UPI001B3C223A
MNTPVKPQLIIIGNGMVGHHLVEQLVERGATERYAITVFGEERHLAYDRVHLSEYFSGRDADSLALSTADYYAEHGIELRLSEAVFAIDRDAGEVVTDQGRYPYDRLVLATGSTPFVPPIPGNDREGCLVYRTLEDLDAIRDAAENAATGVVVGGGLLGLEAAGALRGLNLDTAVVEFAPRLMPMQVDSEGGELLREKIEALGVQVLTGRATQEIVDGEASHHRMVFQDDKVLETDLIVFSAGIRPRDELARDCGLEIGERGGVVIDDHCLTSDPTILAVGEVALWNNSIFGLVAPGYQMAKAAAATLLEGGEAFAGADMSTKLKLMGVDVGSIGDAHGDRTPGARQFRFLDPIKQQYRKLVVSSDGKRLVGAMLVGDN